MANIYNFPFNERKFSQTYDVDLRFYNANQNI